MLKARPLSAPRREFWPGTQAHQHRQGVDFHPLTASRGYFQKMCAVHTWMKGEKDNTASGIFIMTASLGVHVFRHLSNVLLDTSIVPNG